MNNGEKTDQKRRTLGQILSPVDKKSKCKFVQASIDVSQIGAPREQSKNGKKHEKTKIKTVIAKESYELNEVNKLVTFNDQLSIHSRSLTQGRPHTHTYTHTLPPFPTNTRGRVHMQPAARTYAQTHTYTQQRRCSDQVIDARVHQIAQFLAIYPEEVEIDIYSCNTVLNEELRVIHAVPLDMFINPSATSWLLI